MTSDNVSPETRSRMMAGVRGTNTKPELAIRSALHVRGFRFRLHCNDLPGTPDLVFRKHHAVIFVHGCFWHGHQCHLFKWPKTRDEFWREKIIANKRRDSRQLRDLTSAGWRVAVLWECAFKGHLKIPIDEIGEYCAKWLISNEKAMELRG